MVASGGSTGRGTRGGYSLCILSFCCFVTGWRREDLEEFLVQEDVAGEWGGVLFDCFLNQEARRDFGTEAQPYAIALSSF